MGLRGLISYWEEKHESPTRSMEDRAVAWAAYQHPEAHKECDSAHHFSGTSVGPYFLRKRARVIVQSRVHGSYHVSDRTVLTAQ